MSAVQEQAWQAAIELLTGPDEVVLVCHVGPDGDALGSMLALGLALRERGTKVVASWGSEPFEVPSSYSFLQGCELLVPAEQVPVAPDLLVALDTSSPERLGSLADRVDVAGQVLVIDHHAAGEPFGTACLVDADAAATAVLVAELVDRLGVALTPAIAAALYTGLATDTGSFKHGSTTPQVHRLAARLLATGIRADLISRAIWDSAPFGWVRLLGAVCARARLEPSAVGGLGLVWTCVEPHDLAATGLGLADVEGVIDVLRSTQEAEVAVVLKADPVAGDWKVSTRSKGAIDVGAVCASLGGGGHRQAAGFTATDGSEAALAALRQALADAPHLADASRLPDAPRLLA